MVAGPACAWVAERSLSTTKVLGSIPSSGVKKKKKGPAKVKYSRLLSSYMKTKHTNK
jgi:hypothetical protein